MDILSIVVGALANEVREILLPQKPGVGYILDWEVHPVSFDWNQTTRVYHWQAAPAWFAHLTYDMPTVVTVRL